MKPARPGPTPGVSVIESENRVIFCLPDKGYRCVFVAGDFNRWDPAAGPMRKRRGGFWTLERRGLLSGTYGYKYVIDGERWIEDPANGRVETDPAGNRNSLFTISRSPADARFLARAAKTLEAHPPRWKSHAARRRGLEALEQILISETAASFPAVRHLLVRRLRAAAADMARGRPRKGIRVRLLYNHGFIVETGSVAVGFDVIGTGVFSGPSGKPSSPLIDALAAGIDILLVSHSHTDHMDFDLMARVARAGKTVVVPSEAAGELGGKAVPATPGQKLELGPVRVTAHGGIHVYDGGRNIPLRYYEVTLPGGATVLHTADHDYAASPPSVEAVDLLIPKCGGISPAASDREAIRRCLAAVRPRCVLPGHLLELGHPASAGRERIGTAYDIIAGAGIPFEVLFWGESIALGEEIPGRAT